MWNFKVLGAQVFQVGIFWISPITDIQGLIFSEAVDTVMVKLQYVVLLFKHWRSQDKKGFKDLENSLDCFFSEFYKITHYVNGNIHIKIEVATDN